MIVVDRSIDMKFSASFDYTGAIEKVCRNICQRVPELRHIEMDRVSVCFAQTKHSIPFGVFASVTPLRFKGGALHQRNKGEDWTVQRCFSKDGLEYLYILNFYTPRFIELKLSQKFETIVHELYHISPEFNGDLRRFAGRCFAHGSSQKRYDAAVRRMVEFWLKSDPPADIWDFLRFNYKELVEIHGRIHGMKTPAPKVIPVRAITQRPLPAG